MTLSALQSAAHFPVGKGGLSTSQQLKSGPGMLLATFSTAGNNRTFALYDGTSSSGTKLWECTAGLSPEGSPFPSYFSTGLWLEVTDGGSPAGLLSVSYK